VKKKIKKVLFISLIFISGLIFVNYGSSIYGINCYCVDYYQVFSDCDSVCLNSGGCYKVENLGSSCVGSNCRTMVKFTCGNLHKIKIKFYNEACNSTCKL